MLDLRRDLYARLALSAHKDKALNRPFRVEHVDMPRGKKNIVMPAVSDGRSAFEEKVSSVRKDYPGSDDSIRSKISAAPKVSDEKIDEKVYNLVNNPMFSEIQVELEFAEELLKKIKIMDGSNPKIPIIERTVYRLKSMLEQKMYV